MVAMWLPPPTALLASHDLHRPGPVVHPSHHHPQQFLLTSNLPSDFPHHHHTLYTQPTHPQLPSTPPPPKNLATRPSSITKISPPSRIPVKKSFPCPFPDCPQTSSNKGNLSKHIATRHEHRKDFACPFKGCTRRFAKKYNMLRHLSASGVHRSAKSPGRIIGKSGRRASERAKWSSMELDLANFLAKQCQANTAVRAM